LVAVQGVILAVDITKSVGIGAAVGSGIVTRSPLVLNSGGVNSTWCCVQG